MRRTREGNLLFTDLHCHLLPGIDDGAPDVATALAMARIAAADGIARIVCTPHIYPGLYDNDAVDIRARTSALQAALQEADIALELAFGADIHLVPEVRTGLKQGRLPTLNASRYLLLEPAHHVAPPRLRHNVFTLLAHGYVPLITHPERLSWIENAYPLMTNLVRQGAWLQVTAGSLVGHFGRRARYWAERLVGEGWVSVLASDAHDVARRAPRLAEALPIAERLVGVSEARALLCARPAAVWDDVDPEQIKTPPALALRAACKKPNWRSRISGRWRVYFGGSSS